MPTGYTADVQSGKITSFNDYAKQCARAFGALIMQRDDPSDAPIKLPAAEDSYNVKSLAEARSRQVQLRAMSEADIASACATANAEAAKSNADYAATRALDRQRYETMLEKAKAWEPPTQEHFGLKEFMVSQLSESIDFDCGGKTYTIKADYTPAEWYEAQLQSCERNITYNAKEVEEEKRRTEGRRGWIIALFKSLGEPLPQ